MIDENENDDDLINMDIGMNEVLLGGLYKATLSKGYRAALLCLAEAYKEASIEQYEEHVEEIKKVLSGALIDFPFFVDDGSALDDLANCGAGLILAANSFEFATEGFAELVLYKQSLAKSDEQFKKDNV